MKSNLVLRSQLEGVDLLPLPFNMLEDLKYFGISNGRLLTEFICRHGQFNPTYQDIYTENCRQKANIADGYLED